jgi:N-carbamoyl-L-amino-acid hydrolase
VTGVQGTNWFKVKVTGAEAHAGTTPARMRKDALQAAVAMISALQREFSDATDTLRFTVGRLSVEPNSTNTVPGEVTFTVDLRHPDPDILRAATQKLGKTCRRWAGSCGVSIESMFSMAPVAFDASLIELLNAAADALALPRMQLISGAFHDAKSLAAVAPSAMIFIPCAGGISHNPKESATAADIAAGARVLTLALERVANAS